MYKTFIRFKLWAFPPEYADTNGYRYIVVGVMSVMIFLLAFGIIFDPKYILRYLLMIGGCAFLAFSMIYITKSIDKFLS